MNAGVAICVHTEKLMPRPEIKEHVQEQEHICAYCSHFKFRKRNVDDHEFGQAFCAKKNEHFEDQQHGKDAGKRTCQDWQ